MAALRLVRPVLRTVRCQPPEHLLLRSLNPHRPLCAFISSKANLGGFQRAAPFPYKEKKYGPWYQTFDRTIDRFYENSKVLVVDGPIAAGKTTFAKQLAEDLDMLYVPEADLDMAYINENGFDLRKLNPKLPLPAQFLDIQEFTRNPKHPNAGAMQVQILNVRFEQYIDALAHLLNTGQGVILDRSVYSDFVFMEAMFEGGYFSKDVKSFYVESFEAMKLMLKRPHLVIYLDVPVDVTQQRIKERNRTWEVNSPVLTAKYLSSIDKNYKLRFLKEMSVHSEILMYDWSNFGDVEAVVDDIERLDLDFKKYEKKFEDWNYDHDREMSYWRVDYTNNKEDLIRMADPAYVVPELMLTHDEGELLEKLQLEVPEARYAQGYEPKQGLKLLWKW